MTDKKQDKVISMEEFIRSVEGEETKTVTIDDIFERLKEHKIETLVSIGINEEGGIGFFSTTQDYAQILFMCEAFKKVIMDSTVNSDGYA